MGEKGCGIWEKGGVLAIFFFKKGKKLSAPMKPGKTKRLGMCAFFFVVRVIKCVWGRGGSVCVGGGSSWAGQIGKKSRTVVLLRLKRTEAPAERIAVWRRDPPVWL